MSSKTVFDARQRCQVSGASASCASSPPSRKLSKIRTRRPGSRKGSGRRRTARTTEKIAVLRPIPRPRIRTTTATNPGARASERRACFSSKIMSNLVDVAGPGRL
jgi:hypothetical protein